jgi:tetratricopeptide (TPR) repeat protein
MALQLAVALSRFWYLRSNVSEGCSWLAQALAHTLGEQTVIRGKALIGAGRLAWLQGDLERATNFATEGLELFRWLADLPNTARILNLLGAIELYKCELHQAQLLFEQALVLNRQVNNPSGIAVNLLDLGLVATYQQNYSQAKLLLEESLTMRYLQQDPANIGVCLANLGINEHYWGNPSKAAAYYREAISISLSQRDIEHVSVCLEGLAAILVAKGDNQKSLQSAACLFGAAQTFRNILGIPIPQVDQPYYESSLSQLRSQLKEAAVSAAWAEGRAMSVEQAVAYALAEPIPE